MTTKILYNLNECSDRGALADFLTANYDNLFVLNREKMVEAMTIASRHLGRPQWLSCSLSTGMVGPYVLGKTKTFMPFQALLQFGLHLLRLSEQANFNALVSQLKNLPQLRATMFEARIADYFLNTPEVLAIEFANEYGVRGHKKRPDFDILGEGFRKSVECKTFDHQASQAQTKIDRILHFFGEYVKITGWQEDIRMELELTSPPAGNLEAFVRGIVDKTFEMIKTDTCSYSRDGVFLYVGSRNDDLRIVSQSPYISNTVRITDQTRRPLQITAKEANYRIVLSYLERQALNTISSAIQKARRQLPDEHAGLIVLGEAPQVLLSASIGRRINDATYNNINFVTVGPNTYHEVCRALSPPSLTVR